VLRVRGRDAPADHVVSVSDELEQSRADDVRVGDKRHLHLEAVRHGHVVAVHPGDHVEPAGGEPGVEGRAETAIALKRHQGHRDRAGRAELLQPGGKLAADRAVPDDDHLVRADGLVVDRAAERPPKVVGPVTVVHRHQERERLVHMQNSPSIRGEMRDAAR